MSDTKRKENLSLERKLNHCVCNAPGKFEDFCKKETEKKNSISKIGFRPYNRWKLNLLFYFQNCKK
jgi:hypothetical protein